MRDDPPDDQLRDLTGELETVRRVFDAVPMLVIAVEGPQLRVTAVNQAVRTMVGRSHVIGMPLREAFADFAGQQTLEIYEQVYATGETVTQRGYRIQFELSHGQRVEAFIDFTLRPLRTGDGTISGVLGVISDVTARVREEQATRERAVHAEQRYAHARDVIHTLQHELLPTGVPILPGVDIAASYLPADADTAAGGDWYDALTLPDGHIALIVGDVVGHGIAASAIMGQLRVLIHERLLDTGDITTALGAADRMAARIPGARATTVCIALLDPGTGTLHYATAGHPPPLLLPAHGSARYLPTSGGGPLGVASTFPIATDRLEPGDLLLLYTDGILERPHRDLPGATVELAQAATDIAAGRALHDEHSTPVTRVTTQTLELLTRVTGHTDDITLLAAQRITTPPAFVLRTPADLTVLRDIRRRFGEWLTVNRITVEDANAIQHAVGELVTNALEHAYAGADDPGTVTVSAELTAAGEISVRTVDDGRWREQAAVAGRGRGLVMTSDLVDTLRISRDDRGTSATATYRVSRPARLLDRAFTPLAGPARPGHAEPFLVLDQPSAARPRIRVDGPVDATTAASFFAELRSAGAAGTRSLTVDLTGVTLLASAGVAALHRLVDLSRINHTELRLYAPTGTPADTIMTLVQLAHSTTDPDT